MASDLFADTSLRHLTRPLTVFRAELLSCDQASWEELFDGFTALQAITFSSSLEMLLRLADRLDDMEIVFGSESILSREHLALAQASQTIQAYGFGDALVDQKALVEALARLLGRTGQRLLERVATGTLRFRLLRGRPSHEKLYLLSGPAGRRVITGSANLSLAAFEGRQQEVYVAFDGEHRLGAVRRLLSARLEGQRAGRARCAGGAARRRRQGRARDAAGARGSADRAGAEGRRGADRRGAAAGAIGVCRRRVAHRRRRWGLN